MNEHNITFTMKRKSNVKKSVDAPSTHHLPGQYTCNATLTFDTVNTERSRMLDNIMFTDQTLFLIDLTHVKRCDSAGLALLIEAKRLCQQHQKTLKLVNMPIGVRALADFCAVEPILLSGTP